VPKTALIVTDMLNSYEHEDADPLAESVREQLPCIVRALEEAREAEDTMVVYANDNHDQWEAGRQELIERALEGRHPDLVEPIAPREPVPFIAKGRHSIFYQTAVDHLLRSYDVERIVLAGQVTEQCILYSALDAYMRGYEIVVPTDAVAHIEPELARGALAMMERNMHAVLVSVADGNPFG
jgi:nicotinamidase-related amidase